METFRRIIKGTNKDYNRQRLWETIRSLERSVNILKGTLADVDNLTIEEVEEIISKCVEEN